MDDRDALIELIKASHSSYFFRHSTSGEKEIIALADKFLTEVLIPVSNIKRLARAKLVEDYQ